MPSDDTLAELLEWRAWARAHYLALTDPEPGDTDDTDDQLRAGLDDTLRVRAEDLTVARRAGYTLACRRVAAHGLPDFADELSRRPVESYLSVVQDR